MATTRERAETLLHQLAGPDARLREDQGRAIQALVDARARALVVQRTGWGKSAVYFIATKLLRDEGAGPTLIVSPLLALMRDQLAAARRMGLTAETVNSTNVDDWKAIEQQVADGQVDLLLVSPERLNHPRFRAEILDRLVASIGLLVIDEAHCISDHGHDFRPDYRRLRDVLDQLVAARDTDVPVLACTATATDRVVTDVADQLARRPDGDQVPVTVLRGALARDTLALHVVDLRGHEQRLAWIAGYLADHAPAGRAGIVYALTVAEAERVATFLRELGHDVAAYTSRLDAPQRAELEDALKANQLAGVVATTALSMGYDKPDLGFVVHLGAPSSPVAYYQAIGRAGRGGHPTDIVVLPTPTDERLWHHFDVAGIPTQPEVDQIVGALDRDRPRSLPALEAAVNVRRSRLELLLKVLDVEGVVRRVDGGYLATGHPYTHDDARYERLLEGRRAEHEVMRRYLDPATTECSMQLLTAALDDPAAEPCGRCGRCTGRPLDVALDEQVLAAAREHVRSRELPVLPRRRWPSGLDRLGHDRRGNLAKDLQAAPGRALAGTDPSGYGQAVADLLTLAREGRAEDAVSSEAFAEVVDGCVKLLARWDWPQRPRTIVTVPSATHGPLTRAVADRLGELGRLPVRHDVLEARDTPPQSSFANSAHQAANALDTLEVTGPVPDGPVLLVDAVTVSGWTLTVATVLLAEQGAGPVLPLVLSSTTAG
ncbi:DEAD/DEAH box helicase [Egicoccus halophilus]|uniref:DNA 3'-5' helicase n=1 Tax=Egicoccus halophilus TaxID=1670830 RepID=A0A8J3AAD1_9ACTN|nr:DEAD/DEAH box helicase [Egicoccus halophilus]GGI08637.1 ATP-dependent DNA helicase RecQ [Egicoccus halophilus]